MALTLNPVVWIRWGVVALVVTVLLAATAAGAVEQRKINPLGRTGRAISRLTAPVIEPVQRRLDIDGAGHRSAAFWLGVTAIVAGALSATALEWMLVPGHGFGSEDAAHTRRGARIGVTLVFSVLLAVMVAGLLGALAGAARADWWMRPWAVTAGWAVDALAGGTPRVALINLAAGGVYAALRMSRWYVLRVL